MLVGLKDVWKIEHRSLVRAERREGVTKAAIDMKEGLGSSYYLAKCRLVVFGPFMYGDPQVKADARRARSVHHH